MERSWKEISKARKKQQEDAIPPEWRVEIDPVLRDVTGLPATCGLLNPLELEITNTLNIDVILARLAKGEWSSVAVTQAFYKRAIIAHQAVSPQKHAWTLFT